MGQQFETVSRKNLKREVTLPMVSLARKQSKVDEKRFRILAGRLSSEADGASKKVK